MRKSSGMRDFSNFLKDGKQMGEWSSIKQSSGSRAWNVHRGGTGGENCVTVLNSLGLRSPRTDKERNGAWDENISWKAADPAFSSTFRAGRRKRGQDSGICPRTSPVDTCSCPIGQNCRTWCSQAAKGADKRTELGILPSQTRSGRTGLSNK